MSSLNWTYFIAHTHTHTPTLAFTYFLHLQTHKTAQIHSIRTIDSIKLLFSIFIMRKLLPK